MLLLALTLFAPQELPAPSDLPERSGLPAALELADGTPVRTNAQWQTRRAELRRMFERYVYGEAPPTPRLEAHTRQRWLTLDGKATIEVIDLSFAELPDEAPGIELLLVLPARSNGPTPIFLGINKCGNHTVLDDPQIPDRGAWRAVANCGKGHGLRGSKQDSWCIDLLVSRGYGLATFACGDIDPDEDDRSNGIHPWYPDHDWGTLAAWAWGLSRAIDHLATDARIDSDRISAIGHSRRGKTALLAAAFDERIALVVPHQSGTGGCALSRENDQETVARITKVFPHWFSPTFAEFGNGQEARLPVDQHLLVALVAPRLLIETVGLQDVWANYPSSLRGLREASPVWSMLGAPGLLGNGILGPTDAIEAETVGHLLQYRLDTKHVLTADYWSAILDFADLHMTR